MMAFFVNVQFFLKFRHNCTIIFKKIALKADLNTHRDGGFYS